MMESGGSGAERTNVSDLTLAAALSGLLGGDASSPARQTAIMRSIADAIETTGEVPRCRIAPFVPGRRPDVEQSHPGLGSSDCAALVTGGDPTINRAILLYELGPLHPNLRLDATIRWADTGSGPSDPLPGWNRRPIELPPTLGSARRELVVHPETDLPIDGLGFANGFLRRVAVSLCVTWDGMPVAADEASLDVCDIRNLGSLYGRVLERIVAPDTARQAATMGGSGASEVTPIHHPWAPVLIIGTEKASLYTQALVADIVSKADYLSDPSWLLRVGVYLELLTCIGIFEAVREELGDLLSAEEREHYEHGEAFAEVRARVNVEGWKEVWGLRKIAPARLGMPRAGAVSAINLIQKKRATLAFLHVHHEDLKHAIALAGINIHNAQETWQRVFRDAERAVLHKTAEVFPELAYLPGPMREITLWQQHGIAGQQGLYPTACTQYRASMNYVAAWASEHGLMDYTGDECIPLRVSLLDAMMNHPERVEMFDSGDGYLDVIDTRMPTSRPGSEAQAEQMIIEFQTLLAAVPTLSMLQPDELRALATTALPLLVFPGERIVVQDAQGDSLFVVADGEVEVMLRRDGIDVSIDRMGRGSVFGEVALLTGEQRSATVRAIDTALVLEIGPQQYRALLRAHPEWLDLLVALMEQRLNEREARLDMSGRRRRADRRRTEPAIREQMYQRFFSNG